MATNTARKYVFLDVETTGFDPYRHEIIELGCVVAIQDERKLWHVVNEVEIKVKPERIEDADPQSLRVNGYDAGNWIFAHSLQEALKELNNKAKDAIMVAHNVSFDHAFIDRAFRITKLESALHYQKFDTLSIAFAKLHKDPDVKNWSLRALCDYFGIVNKNAHTALADARATYEVFKELM